MKKMTIQTICNCPEEWIRAIPLDDGVPDRVTISRAAINDGAIYAGTPLLSNPDSSYFRSSMQKLTIGLCLFIAALPLFPKVSAEDGSAAARGFSYLRTHQYLPPDFDDDVFASLWTVWPEPDRSAAEAANAGERRRRTFSWYGLMPSPDDPEGTGPALGYVPDGQGNWAMNCLACHGGKVAGKVIPGLPNSHTALQTLTEDVRAVKLAQGKALSHLDFGSMQMPLNTTNGTTNSVIFGIALGAFRNPDMTVDLSRKVPKLIHHDMDAPPFWNVKKKASLYADGFSPKTARPLMQFILLPRVTPRQLELWEPEFGDILAWIESVESPRYPFEVDRPLATRGEGVFIENCSRCHGTYGQQGKYEQQTIPLDEIRTDSVRLRALSPEHRNWMKRGWLSRFGEDHVETDPAGYIAPPLDGIWASAPYFHNGSVPTLWHVMHSDSRPAVWKRTEDGYDRQRIGLEVEEFGQIPSTITVSAYRRRYFDTRLPGKSSSGHNFPDKLDETEKRSVLEYLKTL